MCTAIISNSLARHSGPSKYFNSLWLSLNWLVGCPQIHWLFCPNTQAVCWYQAAVRGKPQLLRHSCQNHYWLSFFYLTFTSNLPLVGITIRITVFKSKSCLALDYTCHTVEYKISINTKVKLHQWLLTVKWISEQDTAAHWYTSRQSKKTKKTLVVSSSTSLLCKTTQTV